MYKNSGSCAGVKNKLKAPTCSIKWQTEEKAKLLNQLRFLNFSDLLNQTELFPSRDLQIFQHMQYKFASRFPNLTKAQAQ